MQREKMELYIHIPFCVQKCNYCDFLSFVVNDDVREEYVDALLRQIDLESERSSMYLYGYREISSIYFGGGTPTVLSAKQLDRIMNALARRFKLSSDIEITIEANPGTVDLNKLKDIRKSGFNRISIGMQSANDRELGMLGRIHTYDEFKKCYINARLADFSNISIDVMTGLPNQTEEILAKTLDNVIALYPEHVSTYSLIIEENTPFWEKYGHVEGPVVGEEQERKLYWSTVEKLKINGYNHYEISNFARKGYESRHNTGYWTRIPYLGLGLGASSFLYQNKEAKMNPYGDGVYDYHYGVNAIRKKNTTSLKEYLQNPDVKEEENILDLKDEIEEYMFLGLRMMKGINIETFNQEFNYGFFDLYAKKIDKLLAEGLIMIDGNIIKLSERGIDYGNYVFSEFLI